MEAKLITFITDFGHKDPFVGVIKGVILGINPSVGIIDLTHGIPPQDILAGALVLRYSAPFFPQGTIHIAVVDPGVGTKRKPLLIESESSFYIGPDNGILSLALKGKKTGRIIELANQTYHLKRTSATFHARDIFAPIAGYLSLGIPPEDLGVMLKDYERLHCPRVSKKGHALQGEIIYIDGFGNLITNIHERDLQGLEPDNVSVSLGNLTINNLAPNYASAGEGGYVALINSWGLLEISIFKGNAYLQCGAAIGEKVYVQEGKGVDAIYNEG